MKEILGKLYSKSEFDEYELRVMIDIVTKTPNNMGAWPYETTITIYTTETDVENVKKALESLVTTKAKSFEIIHTATKEQDEIAGKFMKNH